MGSRRAMGYHSLVAMDVFSGMLPFVAVAEERSFRRAAARLGVTVAAVSKGVKRLEQELGVVLIQRTSRSLSLTAEGEAFFSNARQAVRAAQAAREVVAQSQRVPQGEVKVTLPFILGAAVVRALPGLVAQHPRLSFRFTLTDRFVALADEGIDVAVRIGRLADSGLVARSVPAGRWVTCASPAYLGRRGRPEQPSDLRAHECVRFVTQRGTPREWAFRGAAGAPEAVETRGAFVADHGDLVVEAARAGLGICQAFDFMVSDDVRAGRLVEVLAPYAATADPIHVVTSSRRGSSPKIRAFIDFLLALLGPRP